MLCTKYNDFLRLVIYQIYPRSFFDTNGDGIGDLNGVTAKLDYIKDLDANALWLTPCFKSPNVDNGYDVSDYCDIMDEFGTMHDMEKLIEEAHKRGMKIILDLVPNHTSTEHKWFRESRKGKDNPYSDFYYWYDEIPNDWESAFRGSPWEYDEVRGQYYLHTFAKEQADLNWDNPAVRQAIKDVVDFWVRKGADGFRIDVIDCISKDFEKGENSLGPHLHEYINEIFGRDEVSHLFTVGEGQTNDIDQIVLHCGQERGELSTLFIFDHMECGRADKFTPKKDSLKSLRDILVYWQSETEKNDIIYSLFTGNHDQPPMISRLGDDKEYRYETATDIAAMVYLLKGVPFIYQGQEIGMPSPHYESIDDFNDIECLGYYREMCEAMAPEKALEKVNFGSRDNARRPMAWDGSNNNGFTDEDITPWLKPHNRAKEVNVRKDLSADKSVYRFYQSLLKLRRDNAEFIDGDLEVISGPEDDFFAFVRSSSERKWVVVCNFEKEQTVSLPFICRKPVLANLGREQAEGQYKPYECMIAEVKE